MRYKRIGKRYQYSQKNITFIAHHFLNFIYFAPKRRATMIPIYLEMAYMGVYNDKKNPSRKSKRHHRSAIDRSASLFELFSPTCCHRAGAPVGFYATRASRCPGDENAEKIAAGRWHPTGIFCVPFRVTYRGQLRNMKKKLIDKTIKINRWSSAKRLGNTKNLDSYVFEEDNLISIFAHMNVILMGRFCKSKVRKSYLMLNDINLMKENQSKALDAERIFEWHLEILQETN